MAEEGLGNLTVGRETGLMPIPLRKDDRLRLAGQEGITLTVSAGDTRIDVQDGHNLTVIDWSGVYEGAGEAGVASGAMVSAGPLKGLLSTVQRSLSVPFGDDDETVMLRKHKPSSASLSPEIVSEDDNTPPSIGDLQWRDGRAIGEGAMIAYLEVSITDDEWNVVDVRERTSHPSVWVKWN